MEALLGAQLVNKTGGSKATADALSGVEVVGLYFSAHWCGPCRGFTPELGKFYETLRKSRGASSFEIVFVSSDKDEEEFTKYHGEQADWLALPFASRDLKAALSKKYKVQGIPSLVLIDGKTGALITTDGRSGVGEDPGGANFPYRPEAVEDIVASMGDLKSKTKAVPIGSLSASPLLLYFSAHWCPPCRGFTPQLVAFFTKLKAAHPTAQIIFVSSDHDEPAFDEYFASMGDEWLALPYGHAAKTKLNKVFGVSGIPSLVLLGAEIDGKRPVVTKNGRGFVTDEVIEGFPLSWVEQPFADLSKTMECNGSDINESPAILMLGENMEDAARVAALESLKQVARENKEDLLFFFASAGTGPVGQVRSICESPVDGTKATLVKLDIPDSGGYYKGPTLSEITPEAILAFIKSPGDRKQLSQ